MGGAHHAPRAVPGKAGTPDAERYTATRRVTMVGAAVNVLLSVLKVLLGVVGHSAALVADGIHSLSDLVSDAVVIYAAKLGSEHADERHPYGHGRIETVATVAVGGLLILVATGIAWDATARLFEPERLLHPTLLALAAAVVSVFAKEALFHYTMRVARAQRSNLLRANAWHHRSDAISSVVVIVGIGGAMAGLDYLDAVAAVVVGLMIAKAGWDLAAHSISELVDTALEPERLEVIRDAILEVEGVDALHMLRTRRMGAEALVDVHILVDPTISVSEGHQLSEKVRWHLIRKIDEVADVTVHIDPEDDEVVSPSMHLPLRDKMERKLRACWADNEHAGAIEEITLHYLDGKVEVDLLLPLDLAGGNLDALRATGRTLAEAAEALEEVRCVRVRYH
ncbi:MAG: cation diffusion facilitator family transporter [Gammaproteobacteria bacterium]|nr:cation diffusion facilitator family transporter [Gammaproteobacteria bacterium]